MDFVKFHIQIENLKTYGVVSWLHIALHCIAHCKFFSTLSQDFRICSYSSFC